jgi:hypothetical protein
MDYPPRQSWPGRGIAVTTIVLSGVNAGLGLLAALVAASQECDVVRVGREHAGIGLGIPCVPALNLAVDERADGDFVGTIHRR